MVECNGMFYIDIQKRSVGRRRRHSRLTGAALARAVLTGDRDYDTAGRPRVSARTTHGKCYILRSVPMGGDAY
jgi:hypothetical protein